MFDPITLTESCLVATIKKALLDRHLVVVRGTTWTPDKLVRFAETLGHCEVAWDDANRHSSLPQLQVHTNADKRVGNYVSSSQIWHSDKSFTSNPSSITILRASRLPSNYSTSTEIVNMEMVYDSLSRSLKHKALGAIAVHSFDFQFRALRIRRGFSDLQSADFPSVKHPIVRRHSKSSKAALYLSLLTLESIDGFSVDKGEELLLDLYSAALQPENIYVHVWQPGDVIVIDNESTMHRGTPRSPDGNPESIRELHRVSLVGTRPTPFKK